MNRRGFLGSVLAVSAAPAVAGLPAAASDDPVVVPFTIWQGNYVRSTYSQYTGFESLNIYAVEPINYPAGN